MWGTNDPPGMCTLPTMVHISVVSEAERLRLVNIDALIRNYNIYEDPITQIRVVLPNVWK